MLERAISPAVTRFAQHSPGVITDYAVDVETSKTLESLYRRNRRGPIITGFFGVNDVSEPLQVQL